MLELGGRKRNTDRPLETHTQALWSFEWRGALCLADDVEMNGDGDSKSEVREVIVMLAGCAPRLRFFVFDGSAFVERSARADLLASFERTAASGGEPRALLGVAAATAPLDATQPLALLFADAVCCARSDALSSNETASSKVVLCELGAESAVTRVASRRGAGGALALLCDGSIAELDFETLKWVTRLRSSSARFEALALCEAADDAPWGENAANEDEDETAAALEETPPAQEDADSERDFLYGASRGTEEPLLELQKKMQRDLKRRVRAGATNTESKLCCVAVTSRGALEIYSGLGRGCDAEWRRVFLATGDARLGVPVLRRAASSTAAEASDEDAVAPSARAAGVPTRFFCSFDTHYSLSSISRSLSLVVSPTVSLRCVVSRCLESVSEERRVRVGAHLSRSSHRLSRDALSSVSQISKCETRPYILRRT